MALASITDWVKLDLPAAFNSQIASMAHNVLHKIADTKMNCRKWKRKYWVIKAKEILIWIKGSGRNDLASNSIKECGRLIYQCCSIGVLWPMASWPRGPVHAVVRF